MIQAEGLKGAHLVVEVLLGVDGDDLPVLLVDLLDADVAPVDEGGVLALLVKKVQANGSKKCRLFFPTKLAIFSEGSRY